MQNKLLFLLGFVTLSAFTMQDSFTTRMLVAVSPYVESELGIDLKKKENTLTIIQVDTLTEQDRLNIKGNEIIDILKRDHLPFVQLKQYAVNEYQELYKTHPVPAVQKKIDEAVKEYTLVQAKALPLFNEFDKIVASAKVADNKTFLAYKVMALLKHVKKNNTIKTDTLKIIVNKDFHVIEKKDFIKG